MRFEVPESYRRFAELAPDSAVARWVARQDELAMQELAAKGIHTEDLQSALQQLPFLDAVEAIVKRDGCSYAQAIVRASTEQPAAFERYEVAMGRRRESA